MRTFFQGIFFLIAFFFCHGLLYAQDTSQYGKILNISGKKVTVQFEQQEIKAGDEVEFWRFRTIVDPISGLERGSTKVPVARGIVEEIGVGKTSISITELIGSMRLDKGDRALLTGSKKKITYKTGKIQEISADKKEMTIDLGSQDTISEGDEFLIQRTENIYDPKTNKVTGSNQVDVGKGKVQEVKSKSSTARVTQVQPGMEVLKTDSVVFSNAPKNVAPSAPLVTTSPSESPESRAEIERLRDELGMLKATVDSLGRELLQHNQDFLAVKAEIERIVPRLMIGDIQDTKIVIKNAEPITLRNSGVLFTTYRKALNDCLAHRLARAKEEFQTVMDRQPDSRLVENCRYWIAQCDYSDGNYSAALTGFQSVLDDARFSHKDDDAAIMLGISYFQLGRLKEALEVLHKFVTAYPASEYRQKVERWIEKISLLHNRG